MIKIKDSSQKEQEKKKKKKKYIDKGYGNSVFKYSQEKQIDHVTNTEHIERNASQTHAKLKLSNGDWNMLN